MLMFQNPPPPPLLLQTTAFSGGSGVYNAFLPESSGSNGAAAAVRGFETQPLQQQQQQFSTQMLSFATAGKFTPRPPPLGFQVSQAQVNEYWASLATASSQSNNWKMDYSNNSTVAPDFGRHCTYEEFTPLPIQTGRISSFDLYSDSQSPDALFSPNGDDGQDYGEKRIWSDTLKQHEQSVSHHGLPYSFYDDTSTNATVVPLADFPPLSSAQWTDNTHLDTVSPKALTLSSSSISFSGSSISDCGSIDSVSTHDGLFQSSVCEKTGSGWVVEERQESKESKELTIRHKLPAKPLRQYVAIAPSVERNREVVVARCEGSRVMKVRPHPPFFQVTTKLTLQPQNSPSTTASRNPPTSTAPRNSQPHPQNPMTRTTKDAFLITSKQAGMSYRAIRQAGNFSEAESTLRGRYRTLTKQKEERVRKPEWTEGDVRLLREGVLRFRCGGKRGRGRGGKTPWKRVAEYIEGNGGSYRFGNATCRKMWDRLGEEGEEEEEEE